MWGSRPVNVSNAWGSKTVNVSDSKNESISESGGWGSRSNSGSGWGDSNQKDCSSSTSSGWGRAAMTGNSSWKTKNSIQEDIRGRPTVRKEENGGRDNDRGGRGSEIESWNQSSSLKDNHDRPAFSLNSGNVGRGRGRGRGKDINLPAWMTQGKL